MREPIQIDYLLSEFDRPVLLVGTGQNRLGFQEV